MFLEMRCQNFYLAQVPWSSGYMDTVGSSTAVHIGPRRIGLRARGNDLLLFTRPIKRINTFKKAGCSIVLTQAISALIYRDLD